MNSNAGFFTYYVNLMQSGISDQRHECPQDAWYEAAYNVWNNRDQYICTLSNGPDVSNASAIEDAADKMKACYEHDIAHNNWEELMEAELPYQLCHKDCQSFHERRN